MAMTTSSLRTFFATRSREGVVIAWKRRITSHGNSGKCLQEESNMICHKYLSRSRMPYAYAHDRTLNNYASLTALEFTRSRDCIKSYRRNANRISTMFFHNSSKEAENKNVPEKDFTETMPLSDDKKSLRQPPPVAVPEIGNRTGPHLPPLPPRRKTRVSGFFFSKFFDFMENYSANMEKLFPSAMNVYRVFTVGLKAFMNDFTEYMRITKKAITSSGGIRDLTSVELDIYYRMPKEMSRVAPTLLISALPMMHNVMFPIAYYFPKRLLSSHFWSLQQKSQFAIELQQQRLHSYRPVFRSLQGNLDLIRNSNLREKCQYVLDKLGSGTHPTSRDIMEIKPLFESDPFSLKAIYGPHVKGLCRMHGMHSLALNRRRLFDRAEMLHVMDMGMIRDGIFNLKTEDLKTACFLRGLNASNTTHQDMIDYIQQWSSLSSSVNEHSYSLLLHLPILLAYNNKNNWALLMTK